MPRSNGSPNLASAFLALHEQLTGGGNRESVGQRLVELAVDAVPVAGHACTAEGGTLLVAA